MPPIPINATILSAANLRASIATVSFLMLPPFHASATTVLIISLQVSAEVTPPPPAGLTDKYRWMQCTLKNETQFPLVYKGTYSSSGKYWTAPGSVAVFQQLVFSVCNGDGTIWTGATGGTGFSLVLDSNNSFNISFVSPLSSNQY